jgi:hypothetical protein
MKDIEGAQQQLAMAEALDPDLAVVQQMRKIIADAQLSMQPSTHGTRKKS